MTDTKRILIVIDLEATCDEVETDAIRDSNREMIEVGAVKIDLDTGLEIDSFQSFVRPVLNPELTPFCKQLLNISQEQVDAADKFPSVHNAFLAWAGSGVVAWASWGEFDAYQWAHDASRYHLQSELPWKHLNLKKDFGKAMGMKRRGIGGAFTELGLEMEGERHRALADARHIVRLFTEAPAFLAYVQKACAEPVCSGTNSERQLGMENPDDQ